MNVTTAEDKTIDPEERRRSELPAASQRRYRADVKTALKSFALTIRPWEFGNLQHSFRFFMSIAGPVIKKAFDEFEASEHGPRLLKERPDLIAVLNDHAALRELPEESFGRAYLAYMESAGMATADYFSSQANMESCAQEFGWEDGVLWFMERQAALHDVFHVLSGYDQSVEGEIGVFQFTAGQYPYWFIIGPFLLFGVGPTKFRMWRWYKFLRKSYLHGKNAKPIGHADLERLLPRPLSEVRAALDIKEFDEVHPNGLPKGGWVYEKWAQVVTA